MKLWTFAVTMIMKTAIFSQDIPVYDYVSILAYSKITYSRTKIWTWHDSEKHSMQLMHPPPPFMKSLQLSDFTHKIMVCTANFNITSVTFFIKMSLKLWKANSHEFFVEHLEAFITAPSQRQRWWAGAQTVDSGTLCCLHKIVTMALTLIRCSVVIFWLEWMIENSYLALI